MNITMGLDSSKPNEMTEETRSALSLCTSPYQPFHPDTESVPPPFTMLKVLKHSGPLGLNQVIRCGIFAQDSFSVGTWAVLLRRHMTTASSHIHRVQCVVSLQMEKLFRIF